MNLCQETDLTLTKTLKAPRASVWKCWTTPELFKQFYAPKPHSVSNCELDLRNGGRFTLTLSADGNEIPIDGVFLEIVAGEKLVFTDYYSEGWKPSPNSFMTCIIQLSDAAGGGTEYTVIARHTTIESRKAHDSMGFHSDWSTSAQQLDDLAISLN